MKFSRSMRSFLLVYPWLLFVRLLDSALLLSLFLEEPSSLFQVSLPLTPSLLPQSHTVRPASFPVHWPFPLTLTPPNWYLRLGKMCRINHFLTYFIGTVGVGFNTLLMYLFVHSIITPTVFCIRYFVFLYFPPNEQLILQLLFSFFLMCSINFNLFHQDNPLSSNAAFQYGFPYEFKC